MFKKVQLKFFAITTSILLAIFIAVLASINLIMEAVMQRQTKVVLKKIATSIEYDEKTSTFTYFTEPFDKKEPPPDDKIMTPEKNTEEKTTAITSVTETEENTENGTSETQQELTDDGEVVTKETDSQSAMATMPEESQTADNTGGTGGNNSSAGTQRPSGEEPAIDSSKTTQPNAVTTAANTQKPTPVQTTKAAQPQNTQAVTENVQPQTTTQPSGEQPQKPTDDRRPPDELYPQRPWEEIPPDDGGGYKDDDACYPMPDERTKDWKWEYDYDKKIYSEEPYIEQESYTYNETNIAQTVYQNGAVLDGYTVLANNSAKPQLLAENAAVRRNEGPVPKSLGSIDFFVVMADSGGNFLATLNNDEIDEEVAQRYITAIMKDGASNGMLNSYQFCRLTKNNGTILVFTDKSAELDMLKQLTRTTLVIGAISFVLLSILSFFLSKKSIEPIKVAFEKQKQFVSDASHELKTPLTIISANADVLSEEIGQNKWLTYIKSQAERMNVLVNDLLNLTRLENNSSDFVRTDFNLSQAIINTALPFECQAFESNKKFDVDVEDGIMLNGSENHIKQMAVIFIDNALKYSNDGGTVQIMLKRQGDKKVLSIYNTGAGVHEDEVDKIFERFYRSDDSRCRTTGGYGLGLAIAKSIIDKHKFKVTVNNTENESICFSVIM